MSNSAVAGHPCKPSERRNRASRAVLRFAEAYQDYLGALQAAGAHLVVVLDGMQEEDKCATTTLRRTAQAKASKECLLNLRKYGCRGLREGLWSLNEPLLPLFAVETLAAVCAALSIECIVAEREADRLLAITARCEVTRCS